MWTITSTRTLLLKLVSFLLSCQISQPVTTSVHLQMLFQKAAKRIYISLTAFLFFKCNKLPLLCKYSTLELFHPSSLICGLTLEIALTVVITSIQWGVSEGLSKYCPIDYSKYFLNQGILLISNISNNLIVPRKVQKLTFGPPPCIFKALTVATSTTTLGTKPDALHLMLKNFSIPMSAPKPASVTVKH